MTLSGTTMASPANFAFDRLAMSRGFVLLSPTTAFFNGLNIGNIMLDATQSVAKHVSVVLRDATGNGAVISASVLASLVFKIKKGSTTTYSTITPVATAVGTTGLLDIALTASHLDTLGVAAINITGAGILTNDDLFVDVVAINKNDAVRSGLSAIPNATAGASGGLPTVDSNLNVHSDLQKWLGSTPDSLSSGKVPADLKLWLASAPDALSSGKVASDLKLWLASAPATLSTNGFVKSILLRWLTDDAGGTPSALSTGNVPVPAVDVSTVLTRIGTPAGASVSADIASIKTDTSGTSSSLSTISTKIGTPVGASVSADIAAVKVDTAGIATLSTKVGTPIGASVSIDIAAVKTDTTSTNTNVSTLSTKVGTPVGASVVADIASVKSDTSGLSSGISGVSTSVSNLSTKVGIPAGVSVSDDIAAIQSTTSGLSASGPKIDVLHQIAVGRWKVQGTQLLLYNADGTTVLEAFDLKDDAGDPSNIRIFERVPVDEGT